jgi:hypothetical protein
MYGWMDGEAMHGCEGEALLSAYVRSRLLCALDGPRFTETALAVHGTVKAQHGCLYEAVKQLWEVAPHETRRPRGSRDASDEDKWMDGWVIRDTCGHA